ncbi:MAG: hypothetical protein EZS28_019576 [Streblomastix strix]|uniref:Uncharacterized protein n=1 Tax=Streblomastix strix TaxID=222440 RepID=A0A5J4VRT4_9EUKA|nr:MAG: hypothetical protein EZS28_019576 [Streblomastix strix]
MAQQVNEPEDSKFFKQISTEHSNVKHITIAKGAKRSKNLKSEMNENQNRKKDEQIDEKAKEIIIRQTNEVDKERITIKIECLKLLNEVYENSMSDNELFCKIFIEGINAAQEQVQSRTIRERIEGAVVDLYEYRKFTDDKLKNKLLTGHAIDLCLCKDNEQYIIDFDIDHAGKLIEKEKKKICKNIFNNMLPQNVRLVQTARDGLHVYYNRNGYKLPTNKNKKVATCGDSLEIDMFAQMYTHKDGKFVEDRVVMPESKVRIMDKEVQKIEILHYKDLNNQSIATHLASLFDILDK